MKTKRDKRGRGGEEQDGGRGGRVERWRERREGERDGGRGRRREGDTEGEEGRRN